jgi:hypothetical protein
MNRSSTLRRALAATVAGVAALAVAGVARAAGDGSAVAATTSSNWSGYAVSGAGQAFTDVKATWVEPTVTCPARGTSSSSYWVGLGGYAAGATGLEQIGTSVDCQNGSPSTYSWYELIPAPSVDTNLAVSAGDTISAEVSSAGTSVTLSLANVTTGQSFTTTQTVSSPDLSSAEWIAEAPSQCAGSGLSRCTTLPLVPFGTATFSAASATANGVTGTISSPAWTPTAIQLVPTAAGSASATPGALSTDGSSFVVTTTAAPSTPAMPTTPSVRTTRPGRPAWGGAGGFGRWGRRGHR